MSKLVAIVDYQMGNVASVKKALNKIGAQAIISQDTADFKKATHIVLPGVGAFGAGMQQFKKSKVFDLVRKRVHDDKIPILGICLGMQLFADQGFEHGTHKGLGWIEGVSIRLEGGDMRLPHVGWDDIDIAHEDILLRNLPDRNFYFVHSYHIECRDSSIVTSTCSYGKPFVATLRKENIFGTQFHPEKSQLSGLQLLKNFFEYA